MVSTDSHKISKIAKKYGAEVPFLRSKKLANDFTPLADVLIDCIKKISSQTTKYHFCLLPTTTLILKKDLINSFKKIKKIDFDHLSSVSEYDASPYRALKFVGKNRIEFNSKKFALTRSQDLPKLCRSSGTFYIYRTKSLLKYNRKLPRKSTYYFIDKYRSIDIDTKSDFKFAEFIFKFINK